MLFTCKRSCEKLAKGEVMKTGEQRNTVLQRKMANLSLLKKISLAAAFLPQGCSSQRDDFSTQCFWSWEEESFSGKLTTLCLGTKEKILQVEDYELLLKL